MKGLANNPRTSAQKGVAIVVDCRFAATNFLSPFYSMRHNAEGRIVEGADEFKVGSPLRVLALGSIAMARRERRADEVLILKRDVQDGTPTWNKQPLVAIANKKVRLEKREVEGYVADSVSTVDHGENIFLPTHAKELLVWHTDAGIRGDGVEDRHPRSLALRLRCRNCVLEG